MKSSVLQWSQHLFTSFWLWDHRKITFSGARKSPHYSGRFTQISRLQLRMRRFGGLLGPFGRLWGPLVALGSQSYSGEVLGRLWGDSGELRWVQDDPRWSQGSSRWSEDGVRRKQDGSGWRPDDTGTKRKSLGAGTTKETRQESSSSFTLLFLHHIYI